MVTLSVPSPTIWALALNGMTNIKDNTINNFIIYSACQCK